MMLFNIFHSQVLMFIAVAFQFSQALQEKASSPARPVTIILKQECFQRLLVFEKFPTFKMTWVSWLENFILLRTDEKWANYIIYNALDIPMRARRLSDSATLPNSVKFLLLSPYQYVNVLISEIITKRVLTTYFPLILIWVKHRKFKGVFIVVLWNNFGNQPMVY